MAKLNFTRRDGLVCLLLVLTTLAIYWPLTRAEFTNYDDPRYVVENVNIQSGVTWKAVVWAFTTGYGSNWHPLTWISHMIDWQLYGLNPGKHHLTNLLFHIANTVLLFGLLRFMTGMFWRSALVAAFFAWHPAHVESVAWVAERKDVLSTFFWVLAVWAYVAYVRRPGWPRYALALGLFALGLMAKPMLVTLPCVLLLLDFWPLKRAGGGIDAGAVQAKHASWSQLILEKLPFFAMSAASCVATYYVQAAGGAMRGLGHVSTDSHIANALVSYVRYLGKILWPVRLAVFYPYNESLPDWQVLGAGVVLLGITVWAVRLARQRPYLIVGWFWFLGTLVPVIGLVQVGEASMADRYLYVPALGIFIAVAWYVSESADVWPAATGKGVLGLLALLTLGGCIACTSIQVSYWHDSVALFQHVLDVAPANNQVGEYNLGVAEYNLGQALSAKGKISDAMVHYTEALRFNPNDPKAHNNLGLCLATQGKFLEATNHYGKSLMLNPDNADTHYNYGLALSALGDYDGAIIQHQESLQIDPNQADTRYLLGALLVQKGRFAEAKAQLLEAVRLKSDYPEAHTKLGLVLSQLGESNEGAGYYQTALRLNPNSIEALNNLAWIRAASSRADLRNGAESVQLAQHACELTGNAQPMLLGTLAAAYAEAGQFSEAQATARKAAELALASGQKELAARNRQLLELYQSNRPYHETPTPIESPKP